MRLRTPAPRLALLVAVVALLAGCDTNNGGGSINDVAGTYGFARLRFAPSGGGVVPADVLARLDSAATSVQIFSDGEATFVFEREDTDEFLRANTTVSVSRSNVRFSALTQDDANKLARILLPPTFALSYGSGTDIAGGITYSADLRSFDPDAYGAINGTVLGTLSVELERR
jgi:hypothetical protein